LVFLGLSKELHLLLLLVSSLLFLPYPILSMRNHKETFADIGYESEFILPQVIVGLVIGIVMSFVLLVLPSFLGMKPASLDMDTPSILQLCLSFLYSVFGISLVQVVLVHGLSFKRLNDVFNSTPLTIIYTALLLGLLGILSNSIIQSVITAIIGAFLCLCKEEINHCSLLSLFIANAFFTFISANRGFLFYR
ncbi:MAG: hypothetical protein FWG21_06660, partial [Oscillospiraceae bacterium]|nr:hypothetical protein [Oscillospiraceae bacterium]